MFEEHAFALVRTESHFFTALNHISQTTSILPCLVTVNFAIKLFYDVVGKVLNRSYFVGHVPISIEVKIMYVNLALLVQAARDRYSLPVALQFLRRCACHKCLDSYCHTAVAEMLPHVNRVNFRL